MGWLNDGKEVLPFQPVRHDRFSQELQVTLGELSPGEDPPRLKSRRQLTRQQAITLWSKKRSQGWQVCAAVDAAAAALAARRCPKRQHGLTALPPCF